MERRMGAQAPRGNREAGGKRDAPGWAAGSPAAPGRIPRVLDSSPGAMVRLFIAPRPVTDKGRASRGAGGGGAGGGQRGFVRRYRATASLWAARFSEN